MSTETGTGSPVGTTPGELGEGSPVGSSSGPETGTGSPVAFTSEDPPLPMALWMAFQSDASYAAQGWDPAYSEDGGNLVEVHASWPTKGPFLVQLRTPAGDLLPSDTTGCYSAVKEHGDVIYTNASQEIIRFALPKVPRGTYDLVVTWGAGSTYLTNALRVVPRMVPAFTLRMLADAAHGAYLERRV